MERVATECLMCGANVCVFSQKASIQLILLLFSLKLYSLFRWRHPQFRRIRFLGKLGCDTKFHGCYWHVLRSLNKIRVEQILRKESKRHLVLKTFL